MFKIKNKYKYLIPLFIVGTLTLLQFQNCAKQPAQQNFTDNKIAENLAFFDYRYTSAPTIYYDMQAYVDTEDASYISYKIMGFVANSNGGTDAIDYSIEVLDSSNNLLCTTMTGLVSAGESLIDRSCLFSKTKSLSKISLKVKHQSDSSWTELIKKYN